MTKIHLKKLWVGTLATSVTAALGLALFTTSSAPAKGVPETAKIKMVLGPTGPDFVGDEFVQTGQDLKIVNKTKPKEIGPHFFTLADPEDIPQSRDDQKKCDELKGICGELVEAHKIDLQGGFTVKRHLAKNGEPGWDTVFTNSSQGDSWYTEKKFDSVTQTVSTTGDNVTLNYFCVIHRGMGGEITVNGPTK